MSNPPRFIEGAWTVSEDNDGGVHTAADRAWFETYTPSSSFVTLKGPGNNNLIKYKVEGIGRVRLHCHLVWGKTKNKKTNIIRELVLENVLHVPDVSWNILSLRAAGARFMRANTQHFAYVDYKESKEIIANCEPIFDSIAFIVKLARAPDNLPRRSVAHYMAQMDEPIYKYGVFWGPRPSNWEQLLAAPKQD